MRVYNSNGMVIIADDANVVLSQNPAGTLTIIPYQNSLQFQQIATGAVAMAFTLYSNIKDANGSVYGASLAQVQAALNAVLNQQGATIITGDVNVINTPSVNVANKPDVNVVNKPDVNVINTPDVKVVNTPNVNIQSQTKKWTYAVTITGLNCATAATDIFILGGITGKTVQITEIEFSGTKATGAAEAIDVLIIKRSSANTGGTSTSPAPVAYNSNNPVILIDCKAYTANPTALGTTVGSIKTVRYAVNPTPNVPQVQEVIFNNDFCQRPTLLNDSEYICINLNGTTAVTVENLNIYIEFTVEI